MFAVGDVRSGSVKRVASAVGEGSVAVGEIHEYLAAAGGAERDEAARGREPVAAPVAAEPESLPPGIA